ncbi:TIGR02281 family clan AA aspartic protease [Catenovulum sp. SM1970]|uniref:retropepsin-like aspartic protease family protein n=1 Tax=Marinifaba aquimaris TaxID=2741323 RepID=UPI00157175F1|nr:TIGR02281 family clan AA aspartic protease [Marinifaba aquimaris]NTS76569.1 TIGR02281 family clan AA aspartic protease [Marinifaba aquimaris]
MSDDYQPKTQDSTQKFAKWMHYAAWLSALLLLYVFFDDSLQKQVNPNMDPNARFENGVAQVELKRNRAGHYVTTGFINGKEVTFLLDTGATNVSIPEKLAQRLNLEYGYEQRVNTANGQITVYSTNIPTLEIGTIKLRNISGNINPYMDGEGILLGMSALKRLELVQKGDYLTLRL